MTTEFMTYAPAERLFRAAEALKWAAARNPDPALIAELTELSSALQVCRDARAQGDAESDAVRRARESYATDNLEIDDHPVTSSSDDGTWVSAWVWVPDNEEV